MHRKQYEYYQATIIKYVAWILLAIIGLVIIGVGK